MNKIILDTNSLMAITEFKIDLFTELRSTCDFKYQLFVLGGVIEELKKIIKEQKLKFKQAAKLALSILKVKKVGIIHQQGNVDDILVEYSKKGYIILTQDIELKKRLTKPYLTIRQKKKIILIK